MLTMRKENRNRLIRLPLLPALLACGAFVFSSGALADHKPGHSPPGQGGGGGHDGGGGNTAAYTLTDLGGFTGGDFVQSSVSAVSNLNADGVAFVAGESRMPNGDFHAAVWKVTDTGEVLSLSEIPPVGGAVETVATDANSDGVVVGRTTRAGDQNDDGDYVFPGFVSVPGFPVQQLPWSEGRHSSPGWAINEHGEIVGGAHLWHVDAVTGEISGPIDLLEHGFSALGINDDGVMIGRTWDTETDTGGNEAAIAWFDDDGTLLFEELGMLLPEDGWSEANGINNLGEVVGVSMEPAECSGCYYPHAFLWTPDSGMVALEEGRRDKTVASDINDFGEISGSFLWTNEGAFDLDDLAETGGQIELAGATGINNFGQLVGDARFGKGWVRGEIHGYLLTPNAP
jgi:probable HAF family extracellular repeat protein